jgi:hypothetical protein
VTKKDGAVIMQWLGDLCRCGIIAAYELIDCQGLVLGFDVDAPNALGEQQSFDPVDMRSPLADQPAAFTVRARARLLPASLKDISWCAD